MIVKENRRGIKCTSMKSLKHIVVKLCIDALVAYGMEISSFVDCKSKDKQQFILVMVTVLQFDCSMTRCLFLFGCCLIFIHSAISYIFQDHALQNLIFKSHLETFVHVELIFVLKKIVKNQSRLDLFYI